MKRLIILLYSIISFGLALGQCQGPKTPFSDGEKIRMDVYYHWGPLWLKAARVELKTKESIKKGKKTWDIVATGHTLPSYDWFFKVRDTFSVSILQDGFIPLNALRKTSEGGFISYGYYQFDPENNQVSITSYNNKRPFEKKHFSLKGCTYDLLSGAYFARTLDYTKKKSGEKIPISLVVDNQIYDVYFSFEGSDVITLRDGTQRRAWRFTSPTLEGTVFKGNEIITVWTTDDGTNFPLKVEAKILVGSVQAFTIPQH
jgi:hypothetical protein